MKTLIYCFVDAKILRRSRHDMGLCLVVGTQHFFAFWLALQATALQKRCKEFAPVGQRLRCFFLE